MSIQTELVRVGETQIEATRGEDGIPYANLRRLCEDLGIAFPRQQEKLKSARWATVTNMVTVGLDGKKREMLFVSADTIPMWLATINAEKVAPDVRPAMYVIQDQCKDILYHHFNGIGAPVDRQLMDMRMDISELQTKYTEVMNRVLDLTEQSNRTQNEVLEYVKRIDDRTKGKREGFSPEVKRSFIRCVEDFYQGNCPCCQKRRIIEEGKRIPDVSEMDHYHHRSMNKKEHGWLVCKQCNRKLKNRKTGGYWFQVGPAFQQFQRLLHDDGQLGLFDEFGGAA